MNAIEFFNEMIRSLEEDDEESQIKIKSLLQEKKFIFSNHINSKAIIPDPNDEWVQFTRDVIIKINDTKVYEYSDIHHGYYGGGGAGWFTEEEQNSLEQRVMEVLCYFEIEWPELQVPKPEQLKVKFEDVMAKIFSEAGIDEESNNDFDYWVIEKKFVFEPYIEGNQLGEIPDFNVENSNILNISQVNFDSLINAYFEVYGQYPHS